MELMLLESLVYYCLQDDDVARHNYVDLRTKLVGVSWDHHETTSHIVVPMSCWNFIFYIKSWNIQEGKSQSAKDAFILINS